MHFPFSCILICNQFRVQQGTYTHDASEGSQHPENVYKHLILQLVIHTFTDSIQFKFSTIIKSVCVKLCSSG